jgi:hypothetical protein
MSRFVEALADHNRHAFMQRSSPTHGVTDESLELFTVY